MTRGAPVSYSPEEMRWLEDNRAMIISDYHRAFCEAFKRSDVSLKNLHGLRKRKGWKVGRAKGRYVGRRQGRRMPVSEDEIEWLRENSTMVITDYHREFCAQFSKTDLSAEQLNSLRKREGWRTGRTGRFDKGAIPWSKGKKLPFNANSAKTQFKKGELPRNFKGAGHEYVGVQGYVEMVVAETNPHTGAATRVVQKHRWLWEQANGPVPDGMMLKCLGDKANPAPSNWEMIPRGVLPRLVKKRGYETAPPELKPIIMSVARLEHEVAERAKKKA